MNNLHRELAPISEAAWGQIDDEARRTFKRWIAGRRVVDVVGPCGRTLSAVGTGHLRSLEASAEGVTAGSARRRPSSSCGRPSMSPGQPSTTSSEAPRTPTGSQ